MALKQPLAVKTTFADEPLELKADPGESFLIKDVIISVRYPLGAEQIYATLKIDKTTVGFFRIGGPLGSHLAPDNGAAFHSHSLMADQPVSIGTPYYNAIERTADMFGGHVYPFYLVSDNQASQSLENLLQSNSAPTPGKLTLLSFLAKLGVFNGYPVAAGQTFRVEESSNPYPGSTCVKQIIYEIYDQDDIKPDSPNGSEAHEYMFINYGNCGGSIQAQVDNLYTTSQSPPEFPAFPFGKVVPAKTEIDLIGICASEVSPGANDGTNYSCSKYIKLVKDREVLFDEDRNGLVMYSPYPDNQGNYYRIANGISLFGNHSHIDSRPPLIFPTPITIKEGEELGIYQTLEVGGTGQEIATPYHEIALIEKVRRVE